jgi:hypothetical protein
MQFNMNLAALTDGKFKKYLPFIVIGMGAGAIALFNRQRSNVSTDETSNISTGEIDGKLTEMQSNFNEALQQNAEAMQGNFDDLLLKLSTPFSSYFSFVSL